MYSIVGFSSVNTAFMSGTWRHVCIRIQCMCPCYNVVLSWPLQSVQALRIRRRCQAVGTVDGTIYSMGLADCVELATQVGEIQIMHAA